MKIADKINFRQPKYMPPAIIYVPLLFFGYFVCRFFDTETIDVNNKMETTEYFNDKLPDANYKGDGIGDKYSNMVNSYGKIKDESAVENIERGGENEKEEYTSQYSDAALAAMDEESDEAKESMARLQQLQERIREQQAKNDDLTGNTVLGNTENEEETLANLRKALEEARNEGQRHAGVDTDEESETPSKPTKRKKKTDEGDVEGEKVVNEHAVTEISEQAEAEEVVKRHKEDNEYFNTIATNEPEHRLIRAIIDEDIKAVDGSRVRLRLLDVIDIGERTIAKGTCLYCTMSGFSQQRVKGTVKSVLVNDELVKINLSIYDTDGLEGLYVPKSSFSETAKDIAGSTVSQNMTLNDGSTTSTSGRWGMQALQNAYQKAANALSKSIRMNKVKVKYGSRSISSTARRNVTDNINRNIKSVLYENLEKCLCRSSRRTADGRTSKSTEDFGGHAAPHCQRECDNGHHSQ